jgi:DNA-binding CsgD family transcriptional regulator
MIALAAGRPRRAIDVLREAVALLEAGDVGFLRAAFAALATAHAMLCEVAAAADDDRAAQTANRSLDRIFGIDVMRATASMLAARGEVSAATLHSHAAGDEARASGQHAYEALARHDVARFGTAEDVVDRLAELAAVVDGALVGCFAAHARALADDDGVALDDVSISFADLGFELYAAEASAAAATAHRRGGRKASGFAAAARARELAARCEGARTPALQDVDQPYELTAREREVAALAAHGLASRDIGARLAISTRTVDNLLGRVYSKLGLSGRDELAGYFVVDV